MFEQAQKQRFASILKRKKLSYKKSQDFELGLHVLKILFI